MIAQILPWMRIPKAMGVFDYAIPVKLLCDVKEGSFVTIPFRRSTVFGVVDAMTQDSSVQKPLRFIRSVLPLPPLSFGYREFLHVFAQQHAISPALAFKIAVPKLSTRMSSFSTVRTVPNDHPDLLIPTLPALPHFRYTPFKEWICGTREIRYAIVRTFLSQGGPVLCVTPTTWDARTLFALLEPALQRITRVVDPTSSTQSIAQALQDFLQGHVRVIIGTKRVAFFPAPPNTSLILDEEEHRHHHQVEQNPRYHVRDVLMLRSQLEQFPLYFTGHTRSLELVKRRVPSTVVFPKTKKSVTWISTSDHPGRPLTVPMQNALQEAVTRGQVFLLLNHSREIVSWKCQDCGESLRCSNCHHVLTRHSERDRSLDAWCSVCGRVESLPSLCPACHSEHLVTSQSTLRRLEDDVHLCIGKRTIQRCTKTVCAPPLRSSVIIGTEFAFPYLPLSNLSMVGIVDTDQFLVGKSYAGDFDGLIFLRSLLARVRAYPTIHTVLQYRNISRGVREAAETPSPDSFYQRLLQQRADFSYPPSVPGIALYGSKQELSELKKAHQNLEIFGPLRSAGKHFLLFIKHCTTDHPLIASLPNSIWVDPNPERLPIR